MAGQIDLSLAQTVTLLANTLQIKNSGKLVIIPFDVEFGIRLYDDDAKRLMAFQKKVPEQFDEVLKHPLLWVESDEWVFEAKVRLTEEIVLFSDSNYVGVWSSLDLGKNQEGLTISYGNTDKAFCQHAYHDSCWRIGIEEFERIFNQKLLDPLLNLVPLIKPLEFKFDKQYWGTGFDKVRIIEGVSLEQAGGDMDKQYKITL